MQTLRINEDLDRFLLGPGGLLLNHLYQRIALY